MRRKMTLDATCTTAVATMSSSDPPSTIQVQQQQEDSSSSSRDTALREALDVMESSTTYERLQGFNLLGVVANPRSGGFAASMSSSQHSYASTLSPSHHVRSSSSDNNSWIQAELHQFTEQIDALNQVLEQWSRHYLGTYSLSEEDASVWDYLPPQDVLLETELPEEFTNLSLQSVQDYLEQSGILAHEFHVRKSQMQSSGSAVVEPMDEEAEQHDNEDETADLLMEELQQSVPSVFFESDFDLTDPKTFCELLVLPDQEENAAGTANTAAPQENNNDDSLHPSLTVSTHDILRLPQQDSFTTSLDKVEVALLNQVRSKSVAFFHETNRFSQLKEWIAGLVKDVKEVRDTLQHAHDNSCKAWESIPHLDDRRADLVVLQSVLEGAQEVVRTKSSIGGLLSASDDLMAAQQIQYAQRLLDGTRSWHDDGQEEGEEMGRLVALSTVGDQLSQYQTLVENNLSEELVEIFMCWKTTPSSKQHVSSSFGDVGYTNGTAGSSTGLPRTIQETRQRVRDIVKALGMCKSLTKTGKAYGNRLNDVIRIAVRTTVEQFASDGEEDANISKKESSTSVTANVTSMSLERFVDCLDMLFEQLLVLMKSAVGVNKFCREEGFTLKDEVSLESSAQPPPPPPVMSPSTPSTTSGRSLTATAEAVNSATELSSKSISELLRLRKEAHSLVSLEEMKRLWDACIAFTMQLEKASGHKAYGLRSTLLAQAKAFVERKHESNMSALVAALDSERWTQCDVSAQRQAALTRLCSGRAVLSPSSKRAADAAGAPKEKMAEAEVEGIRYKVVWSCLLLVEMVMNNVASAACFQALATNVVGKVAELLRLFNSRTTQLVLGAGAIQSAARLKSINAKHLSLVTQCLGMIIAILPHVRAALMAQLPAKQHTLLVDLDKIKKEYGEHNEKVLNKFVTIIGGIVEHGLAPRIANTDFDARVESAPLPNGTDDDASVPCCVFLDGVFTNTKKMHQVLKSLLPGEHLQDVFSRIFAYLDQKLPVLFIVADAKPNTKGNSFNLPSTNEGKRRMLLEVEEVTRNLNELAGVRPWDFSAKTVLERKLDFELQPDGFDDAAQQESTVASETLDAEEAMNNPAEKEGHVIASPDTELVAQPSVEKEVQVAEIPQVTDNEEDAPVNGITEISSPAGADSTKGEVDESNEDKAVEGDAEPIVKNGTPRNGMALADEKNTPQVDNGKEPPPAEGESGTNGSHAEF